MKSTIYRQAYPNPYHECIEVPDEPPEYISFHVEHVIVVFSI